MILLVSVVLIGLMIWGGYNGFLREFFLWAAPLAPFSTAFVAIIAGIIAWETYKHRRIADNRAEWWRRTQYAIDLVTADDDRIGRNTGLALLALLAKDPDPTDRDLKLIKEITSNLINEILLREENQTDKEDETLSLKPSSALAKILSILKPRKKVRRHTV